MDRERLCSNPIEQSIFLICHLFFSLINGYVYLYTKKKKNTKTQRLPFRCLISSVNISRNTAGALNHSRIRPALRSISSSKYASPKLSLVSDRIAKEKR